MPRIDDDAKHLLMAGQVSDTNGNFRRNFVASKDDLEAAKAQGLELLEDHYDWINIITVRHNTPVGLVFWDANLGWIAEDLT